MDEEQFRKYVEQNQKEHYEIKLCLQKIQGTLDGYLKDMKDAKKKCEKHIEESVTIRDQVRDNTKMTKGMAKALWILYGSVVSLLAKVFLFK